MAMNRVATVSWRFAKRLAIVAFDVVAIAIVSLLALPALSEPAWAYVDPSVMTYTIQALAGVAVALSAVAGVAFRRTRKVLLKSLNIDENAHKITDSSWERIPAKEENLQMEAASIEDGSKAQKAKGTASGKGRQKDVGDRYNPSWAKRFITALVVVLFCGVTVGIVAPIETVAGASSDLLFGVKDVAAPLIAATLITSVVLALVLSLIPRRVFIIVVTFVFSVGLCCYLQAMALNEGLPAADGRAVDWWGDHQRMMELSLLLWIVVLTVPTVLSGFKPKQVAIGISALSLALVIVQGVGAASLMINTSATEESSADSYVDREKVYGTETGLFEVSRDNNVIIFVLDMYDTRTLMNVMAQNPDMLDEMSGFMWYQNSVGPMLPTNYALPYLITGVAPQPGQDLGEYNVDRYMDSDFLDTLHDSGYFVGVYSPMLQLNYLNDEQVASKVFANVDNFHELENFDINKLGAVKSLFKVALYRDSPWVLKGRFRFYTDDLNQSVLTSRQGANPDGSVYVLDDGKYYEELTQIGLSFDDGSHKGAYKLIHLNGAHFPYCVDETGTDVGSGNSTLEAQAVGSMRMVSDYLRMLKDLGVYDSSTIVITADHGEWVSSPDLPTDVTTPIALVKEANAGDGDVVESKSPVSHEDLFGTVYSAMGVESDEFTTRYSDSFEEDRPRFVYQIGVDDRAHIRNLFGYEVIGDVLDFSNWNYTGLQWEGDVVDY